MMEEEFSAVPNAVLIGSIPDDDDRDHLHQDSIPLASTSISLLPPPLPPPPTATSSMLSQQQQATRNALPPLQNVTEESEWLNLGVNDNEVINNSNSRNRYGVDSSGQSAQEPHSALSDELLRQFEIRQRGTMTRIQQLKDRVTAQEVKPYTRYLEEEARDGCVTIGQLSVEQVEAQERAIEEDRIRTALDEARRVQAMEDAIIRRERMARARLEAEVKKKEEKIRELELKRLKQERHRARELRHAFRNAEDRLRSAFRKTKVDVEETFGILEQDPERGHLADLERNWKVSWKKAPQPVRVRIDTIRAIKDKLPKGRFVMLVTIFDRLGGIPLQWSSLSAGYRSCTLPITHLGRYFDVDMVFRSGVQLISPSEVEIRPSMVLCFELFMLKSRLCPVDTVVAWGAFPLVDSTFRLVNGKFKVPMMKGEMDLSVKKWQQVEVLMRNDLSNWVGNLYFKVTKLSRTVGMQREHQVKLQYTSRLLGLDGSLIAIDTGETIGQKVGDPTFRGGTAPVPNGTSTQEEWEIPTHAMGKAKGDQVQEEWHSEDEEEDDDDNIGDDGSIDDGAGVAGMMAKARDDFDDLEMEEMEAGRSTAQVLEIKNAAERKSVASKLGILTKSRRAQVAIDPALQRLGIGLSMNAHQQMNEKEKNKNKKELKEAAKKEEASAQLSLDLRAAAVAATSSHHQRHTRQVDLTADPSALSVPKDYRLGEYMQSVPEPSGIRDKRLARPGRKRLFILREVLGDLGFRSVRSLQFWLTLLLFFIFAWFRLFPHYLAEYAFLYLSKRPILGVTIYPYAVDISYNANTIPMETELGAVIVGPASNIVISGFLIAFVALIQRGFGGAPNILYTVVAAFSAATAFDPLLIFIVDCIRTNFDKGDAFKLWNLFSTRENSGSIGFFLTIILYFAFFILSLMLTYVYLFFVYRDGRILDVFRRLEGKEEAFFAPLDTEMTLNEVRMVLYHAERWRGPGGMRRKLVVTDIKVELPNGPPATLTHLGIFCTPPLLPVPGLNEEKLIGEEALHRQFLKLADGTIVEILGEELDFLVPPAVCQEIEHIIARDVNPTPAQSSRASTPIQPYHQQAISSRAETPILPLE